MLRLPVGIFVSEAIPKTVVDLPVVDQRHDRRSKPLGNCPMVLCANGYVSLWTVRLLERRVCHRHSGNHPADRIDPPDRHAFGQEEKKRIAKEPWFSTATQKGQENASALRNFS